MSMLMLISCGCGDPDREPYSRHILWENASLVNQSGTNTMRFMDVEPGTNLVLEIRDGFYRSKTTTAHSSHDAVYLVLPGEPQPWSRYRFTFADGNLEYDGFAGYWIRGIDTNMPATAEMFVEEVTRKGFTANLRASIYFTPDVTRTNDGPPMLFTVDDHDVLFQRMNMRDCRTNACTLRRVPRRK